MSNHELLHRYRREHSQAAFAALVAQHVDLVYSAALRQVRAPHLAEEVTQAVFTDLARQAREIPDDQPLTAWLYVVTRRTAIDAIRREARRREAEAAAAATLATMRTESSGWTETAALLDEGMAALDVDDRNAILLRYFEHQSLRKVGHELGVSEDTAQKRVSRALERLRAFFLKRGLRVASAAALATDLSAHAVQAAPAGIVTTISSAAALPSVVAAATQHLAMTATQKILATAAIGAALALALNEGVAALRVRRQVSAGQQRIDALADTARQLRLEQIAAARQLAEVRAGHLAGRPAAELGTDAAMEREAAAWIGRLAQLRAALARDPALNIPELQLLTESDWLLASLNDFSRPERVAESLRLLRTRAKSAFARRVFDAVRKPFASTQGASPAGIDDLVRLLEAPVHSALLARYDFRKEEERLFIAEKLTGAADPDRLTLIALEFTRERGMRGYVGVETAAGRVVREAARAYAGAHGGAAPTDAAQLLPFLPQPMDAAEVAKLFAAMPLSPSAARGESP